MRAITYLIMFLLLVGFFFFRKRNLLLMGEQIVSEEEKETLLEEVKGIYSLTSHLGFALYVTVLIGACVCSYLYFELEKPW